MSTTIDSKVLEMRFDNKQFESGVATTMSTLDKLKQKLNLTSASKGLEDVGTAAKKIDLSGLSSGAEKVGLKFNAMYTIADQALRNITNSAMDAGKRIVSALTIDPVKTGLSEYETKIGAIQVIKANTRSKYDTEEEQMAAIEKTLADLNDYADRTIYNYTQMTDNLGKFVNQGLDLDEAANAVMGLANLAGASGASAQDMARATYQMSQAMGGVIRKIDWNSLRNANMAGTELKNVLMDLARVEGIDIDGMIESKGIFEDTLEEGWLTGELFTKAMNIYSDVYSEAELKAMGFKDAQIENFKALAKTAREATVEVKTMSQLWDVLKETAQSGWTQTWEIIFGDFNTAKKMFTQLQVYFSNIINGWSNTRNFIVEGVLNFSKPWQNIIDKIGTVTDKVKTVTDVVGKVTGTLEYFQDVVDRVWRGDFKNRGDNPDRRDLLTQAGYDHRVVQYLVNLGEEAHEAGKKYKLTMEDIEAAHKKYGLIMETSKEETEQVAIAFNELTDEKLKDAGLTEDEIALYRALEAEAARLGISMEELADKMANTSGRSLLIGSVKDVWNGLLEVLDVIKTAWVDIFDPPTSGEIIVKLYGMLESLKRFTETLTIVDKETGKLTETGDKLLRVFKGVFAIVDIVATILSGGLRIAFKIASQVLSYFGMGVLDVAAIVSDAIVAFHDFVFSLVDVHAILDVIVPIFTSVFNWISNLVEAVKGTEAFQKFSTYVKNMGEELRKLFSGELTGAEVPITIIGKLVSWFAQLGATIGDVVDKVKETTLFKTFVTYLRNMGEELRKLFTGDFDSADAPITIVGKLVMWFAKLGDSISNLVGKVKESSVFKLFASYISTAYNAVKEWLVGIGDTNFNDIFDNIVSGVKKFGSTVWNALKQIPGVGEWLESFIGTIGSFGNSISSWFAGIKDAENIPQYIIQGLVNGLKTGISAAWDAAIGLAKALVEAIKEFLGIHSPSTVFMAIGGFIIAGLIYGIKNGFGGLWDTLSGIVTSLVDNFKNFIQGIDFGAILAGGILAGLVYAGVKIADAVSKFSAPFESVGEFLEGLTESIQRVSKGVSNYLNSKALLNLAYAIGILAAALVILSFVNVGKLWSAVGAIVVISAVLTAMMVIISKLDFDSGKLSEKLKIIAVVAGLAVSLLLVATAFSVIAGISTEGLAAAVIVIAGFAGIIVGLMAATKLASDRELSYISKLILSVGAAMLIMAYTAKTIASMEWSGIGKAAALIAAFAVIIVGLMAATKLLKSGKSVDTTGAVILKIAAAMLLMTLVAKIAGSMEWEELGKAAALIGAFAAIIVGLMAATKLTKNGKSIDSTAKVIQKIAVAMLLMAVVAKIAGSMEWEELGKAAALITAFGGIIVGLMAATKLTSNKELKSVSKLVLTVGTAMLLMAYAAKAIGSMEWEELGKAGVAIAVLAGIIVGLLAATKLATDKELKGVASTLLAASLAIGVMALVAVLLGVVDADKLKQGISAVGYLAVMIAGLMAVSSIAGDCKSTLIGISIAIAALAASVILLSFIEPSRLQGATIAIAVVLGMLALVLKASSDVKASIGVLITLTVMIGLLAGLLFVLAKFSDGDKLVKSAIALGVILLAMAGVLSILSEIGPKAKNAKSGIGAMALLALVVGELAVILGLMSMLKLEASLGNVSALSVMLIALTLVLYGLSLIGPAAKNAYSAVGALAILSLVVGILGVILGGMAALGLEASMNNVLALSAMIIVLTGVLAVLSLVGMLTAGATPAIGALAILSLVVGILAVILGGMAALGLEASMNNVLALSAMMIVLTGVLAVLALIGLAAPAATPAIGAMAILALIVGMLAVIFGGMAALDIEVSMSNVQALSTMLIVMTGVLAAMALIGPFVSMAYASMLALVALIAVVTGVIAALGGLSKIPGFNELIADGGAVLGMIGQAIGSFIGGLVGGVMSGIASTLPEIGLCLSQFMVNATPFIVGVKMVDDKVLAGVGILAGAILALTAADVISGMMSWMSGGTSFADLGTELSLFMANAMPFIQGASMLNEDMVAGVKGLAETILILTAANVIDGLTAWFTGGSSLETFAAQLPILAQGLSNFKAALDAGGVTEDDLTGVKVAADAVKILAEASNSIPNSGGWLGAIVGDNDLDVFAEMFPKLGEGLVGFKNALGEGGFTEDDLSTVETAANAVKILAEVASEIPNSGGWLGKIVGENDLGTFATQFPLLATGLAAFKTAMGTAKFTEDDLTAVETAANAVKIFSQAAESIPNSGGWVAAIIGDNDLATFASSFPDIASGLAGFKTNIGEWTEDDSLMITHVVDAITSLADVAKKINEDTSIWDSLNDDFMDFVGKLPDVGTNLKNFGVNLGSGFSLDTAEVLKIAANSLKIFSTVTVSEDAGTNLSTFAGKLPSIGANLKTFGTNMKGVSSEDMAHASSVVSKLKTIVHDLTGMNTDSAFSKANACRNMSKVLNDTCHNLAAIDDDGIAIGDQAIKDLVAMVEGLVDIDTSGVKVLADALKKLVDDSIVAFADAFSSLSATRQIDEGIRTMVANAVTAVSDNSSVLSDAFSDLVAAAVDAVGTTTQYTSFYNAGGYLVKGFAAGISDNAYKAKAKASAMATAAKKAAEVALGINSPSKVFYQIGDYAGQGFTNALHDYASESYAASTDMATSARDGLKSAIGKMYDAVSTNIDSQPTIRPVLDLSEVEAGANRISGMFSMGGSVGVLANVGAINTMMNQRSQNGRNGDVVSAINKLRGDMANRTGDTYNINGVTYDDGSNINEAVKVIVRAAKIERRR